MFDFRVFFFFFFVWFFLVGGSGFGAGGPALDPIHFPVDAAMRVKVDFWKRVYTEISSGEGFLHDSEDLSVVYSTISVKELRRRAKRRFVRKSKKALKALLLSIASKGKVGLSPEELTIFSAVESRSVDEIRRMARRIRFQQGLSDRYYKGLVRSYLYLDKIIEVFSEMGLPIELAFLPHVESSFNYNAYSKVGAAGIWQFMRSTARLYRLKVSYVVDERRDPVRATYAAAQFLKDNYKKLKTWPLALTAYNHGPRSLERAVKKLNTRDLSSIIEKYEGRRFGFASKNFYATFVATVEISRKPQTYFSQLEKMEPIRYSVLSLNRALTVAQLSEATGLDRMTIKEFNRALRPIAFRAPVYIPKGYEIKVPWADKGTLSEYDRKIASLHVEPESIKAGGEHIVARGESLYLISKIYRVPVTSIVLLNEMTDPSRIYPGMKLKIPTNADAKALRLAKRENQKKVSRENRSESPPNSPAVAAKESAGRLSPSILERLNQVFFGKAPSFEKPAKKASQLESFESIVQAASGDGLGSVSVETVHLEFKSVGEQVIQVEVEAEETLGHYADWALVKTQEIRNLNGLGYREAIQVGQKIRIRVPKKRQARFLEKRIEFHVALQEDFFSTYRLSGVAPYVVKKGDTVGGLVQELEVPVWLLRRYQPRDQPFHLFEGQVIQVPVVEPLSKEAERASLPFGPAWSEPRAPASGIE